MAYIPTVDEFNSSAQFKVAEWSRNTVADGNWLQKNTMRPLKERDDFILSLLKDLGNTDSWKQWSENHDSSSDSQYPDASAIYIGPNNKILLFCISTSSFSFFFSSDGILFTLL